MHASGWDGMCAHGWAGVRAHGRARTGPDSHYEVTVTCFWHFLILLQILN